MNKMKIMLKATIISLCLLLSTAMYAQEGFRETIYLKNGSVIKGRIIEETIDQLKIETPNGSIFIVGSYDVDKIVRSNGRNYNSQSPAQSQTQQKETQQSPEKTTNRQRRSYSDNYNENRNSSYKVYENDREDGYYEDNSTRHSLYKGFVELGYAFGLGDSDNGIEKMVDVIGDISGNDEGYNWSFGRFEFLTSHGIVLNRNYNYIPIVFIGAGVGSQIYSKDDTHLYLFPFFAHTRIHFFDSSISPFVDFKLGYSWGSINSDNMDKYTDASISISGLYLSPAIGVRIATDSRAGINLSLGYTNQKISKISLSSKSFIYDFSQNLNINLPAISLKLGFDF